MRKLRLTGGEPLVRKNLMWLIQRLSRHLDSGALDELTLTTNGSQLGKYAEELAACGVKRVNVSIDTLDPDKFTAITRWGKLGPVLDGIKAANAAGIKVKINTVALKGVNDDEAFDLIDWCGREGHDLTFIEVMPMGDIGGEQRLDQYLPISLLRAKLKTRYTLDEIDYRTGGPARYARIAETGQRVGFITPLTHNFCESCNRVRLTCTGMLYMCLGQDDVGRPARALARQRRRRAADGRDRRSDRPQAQGPRLHHRPPPQGPGGAAAYERHGRLAARYRFSLEPFPHHTCHPGLEPGSIPQSHVRRNDGPRLKAGVTAEWRVAPSSSRKVAS